MARVRARTYITVGSSAVTATTTSNKNPEANLTMKAPFVFDEDPSMRGCGMDPGRPVNVATGNVYFDQTDATVPGVGSHGLGFARSYNSANVDPGRYGMFGPGWFHTYEKRISQSSHQSNARVLLLRDSDGVPNYFNDADNDGTY
jgi:hypothetical protein